MKRFHAAGICDCCDAPTCQRCGELVEACDCERKPRLLDLLPAKLLRFVVHSDTGCWLWLGWQNDLGYGYVRWEGRDQPAHRVIFRYARPDTLINGLDLDHLCRNPRCVNPDHLDPVTHRENIKRGRAGSKTSCKYGHDWTDPKNVYVRKDGRRWCAACQRERWSHAARKARAEA